MQLLVDFSQVALTLIPPNVVANRTRKYFVAEHILAMPPPKVVEGHGLVMKANSENFRHSATQVTCPQ